MSQTRRTSGAGVVPHDWDVVLAQLRSDGFSPTESIKVTRAVLHVGLAEAKEIVHTSVAWSDRRDEFDDLHDAAETLAQTL